MDRYCTKHGEKGCTACSPDKDGAREKRVKLAALQRLQPKPKGKPKPKRKADEDEDDDDQEVDEADDI